MTRGTVNLPHITNHSARKATSKKRKAGLMKAAYVLSTLSGINKCGIIFSPCYPEPYVWPSELDAHRVIARFKNMSVLEHNRRMVN
ncbi:hypothetical protein Vadar_004504 [Vaccinium darrowii]|uniref:Uncharacterized protein n=1 Tax=Vaccinium darrowii TaxID=229202 RepID=A0ACB7ZAD7_9ERIC|nr:hypothetical protein Vadar_004504 [Vaccinium darrowii]